MILFWLVCATFIAIALAFILPPLLQGSGAHTDESELKEANIAVYKDQLSELEADLANGIVSQQQFDQDRDEIERRLLEDVSSSSVVRSKQPKSVKEGRGVVYAVALGLPIIAVALVTRMQLRRGPPFNQKQLQLPAVSFPNNASKRTLQLLPNALSRTPVIWRVGRCWPDHKCL
jgi:cytochrome c-type biogenesis protein CcmH